MFKKSLDKCWKNGLVIYGLDILHAIIASIIMYTTAFFISRESEKILTIDPANLTKLDGVIIESFSTKFIIYLTVLVVLLIINWSVLKGLVFTKLMKHKFNFQFFKKFLLLNCIIFALAVVFIPLLIFLLSAMLTYASLLKSSILMFMILFLFLLPLFMYIINTLNIFYMNFITKKNYIRETLIGIKQIKRIKKMYLPYLAMGFVFFLLSVISNIIQNENINMIISLILFTAFFTYNKFFIIELEKHV